MIDARKEQEKEYFNNVTEHDTRSNINFIYSDKIIGEIDRKFNETLLGYCIGKKVLEIGCGQFTYTTFMLAKNDTSVVGIDISDKSIEYVKNITNKAGIKNISYRVMDAEHLDFPDNSFDVVFGRGILHHLHLEPSMKEICRVLKPDGVALFQEPLGHNIFINLFRKLTPGLRTEDEHPLKKKELEYICGMFGNPGLNFYYFLSILAIPLSKTFLFTPVSYLLKLTDKALFASLKFFRYQAWQVLITLNKPRK